MDPTSYARPDQAKVTHFHWVYDIDFEQKRLVGSVEFDVSVTADGAETLRLDTRELEVTGASVPFELGEHNDTFGSVLSLTIPEDKRTAGSTFKAKVDYRTSPSASAIQWYAPEQTSGKEQPYMDTQCQAIHARSMVPCQDLPGVKATYSAEVRAPKPLVVLMSALHDGSEDDGDSHRKYRFKQPVPMCAYLVSIACGALVEREIGPRSSVWAEKEVVDKGAYEFADTEKFLLAAEAVAGPYVWGRYDLLVQLPGAPYGGMENTCLSYVTPTLLAGDRSLANVVAHEAAHSWAGNLVSPESWSSFFLNEGTTVFLERKIIRAVYGREEQHLHAYIGSKALRGSIERFGADHAYTALDFKLDGTDPDDSFSSVPYEKGFQFYWYLEWLIGGKGEREEALNPYLLAYFDNFKYKSIGTEDFKAFFLDFHRKAGVAEEVLAEIDWDTWLYKPGYPPVEPTFDLKLVNEAVEGAKNLFAGTVEAKDVPVGSWSSNQVVVFLETVLEEQAQAGATDPKAVAVLEAIDAAHVLTASKNAEIRFRWYQAGIRANIERVYPAAVAFLAEQGRMKFTRPLYRDLAASAKGKEIAVDTFTKNRSLYHIICAKMVARDLGIE